MHAKDNHSQFRVDQTVFFADSGKILQGKVIEVTFKPKAMLKIAIEGGNNITLPMGRVDENLDKAKIKLANYKLYRFEQDIPFIVEGLNLITDDVERKLTLAKIESLFKKFK